MRRTNRRASCPRSWGVGSGAAAGTTPGFAAKQHSPPAVSPGNLRRMVVTANDEGWSDASLDAASTGAAGSEALGDLVPLPSSIEISQVRNGAVTGDALRTISQTAHVGRRSLRIAEAIATRLRSARSAPLAIRGTRAFAPENRTRHETDERHQCLKI